ncbi:hypothetical protein ORV05_16790 [Amycolatopsis cynarae]|uniref:Uncharacterized protein n=1 Tax=Amycolatopsis cynarae TaxID=2995223 RepID=A0ABY7BAI0_9PSEU|nr:hypothetical protein [Amycolatopsis sp. HUAS 11-8]WAL69355.1 hypothetical protein ORV05_16790 [Amycolatopsis sp. HUAS 11-8]
MDRQDDAASTPLADLSWLQWPDGLKDIALEVLARWQAGHPGEAVDLIDEMLADLASRREFLGESANRLYEPSTDDRNL